MSTTYGTIRTRHGEAQFSPAGWRSPDRELQENLNLLFGTQTISPSQGVPGRSQVVQAATFYGGTYELPPLPPEEPEGSGKVY